MRVDVRAVGTADRQEVHPETVEVQLTIQLESALRGEPGNVSFQEPRHVGKCGVAPGQVVQRCVARIALVAAFPAPAAAGLIVLRKDADRVRKLAEQGLVRELGVVNLSDEERAGGHRAVPSRRYTGLATPRRRFSRSSAQRSGSQIAPRLAGAVERSCRYGDELAGTHGDLVIRKFDDQLSVDAKESLVGVGMSVPVVLR